MNNVSVNGVNLFYQSVGDGEETVLFSHGYLMNHSMFDGQIQALSQQFRCISYDHRGHGQSEVTKDGYELDNLVNDAIALIEELNLAPVHFVGMSTGGFIGMRIAIKRPDLLASLVLMDTSAQAEPPSDIKKYRALMWIVKYIGWWPVINQAMQLLFYKHFLDDPQRKAEVKKWRAIISGHNKQGMIRFGKGIFSRSCILEKLSKIDLPTAIIVGEKDVSTTPDCSKTMANAIKGSKLYIISDAGHSAAVENPHEVASAIQDFYQTIS